MEKEFIPYEEALALKALGFDEPCFGWYSNMDGNPFRLRHCETYLGIENCVKAPTFSQAFKWFREKYNLYPSIISHDIDNHIFTIVGEENYESDDNQDNFENYEEAELSCLRKLIELVKS